MPTIPPKELTILDADGNPTGEWASAAVCHRQGLWHRGVDVLLMTDWGTVVIKRQAVEETVEPGRWTLPGGHVYANTTVEEAVLRCIAQAFELRPDPASLTRLTEEDAVVEESIWEEEEQVNREYKTLFAYTLSWEAYQSLQDQRAASALPGSDDEVCLELPACEGPLRFVSMKALLEEADATPTRFAGGMLAVIRDNAAQQALLRHWTERINRTREAVVKAVLKATGEERAHRLEDTIIRDAVLPQPDEPAAEFDVENVFIEGKHTCPGAYRIGEMMAAAGHLKTWKEKLSDPYHRYVEEELGALRRSVKELELREQLEALDVADASRFVREVLHFPLEDGSPLRMQLGNLEEITAGRCAIRLYLRLHTGLSEALIDNPLKAFSHTCNRIVREVWEAHETAFDGLDDDALCRMLRLNVLLNALDFNSPGFKDSWAIDDKIRILVEEQFDAASQASFSPQLGGDAFLTDFLDSWLAPDEVTRAHMVYLTDNNGQLVVSLKCVESFLRRRPSLTIILVPKNGQYANDASWKDVDLLLEEDARADRPLFEHLRGFVAAKRLVICRDGPKTQGLHPGGLSRELCFHLRNADAIFAEGQAHAEIRGWLKPAYLLFRVKGRVAEAVHGVERRQKVLAFVCVGKGAIHFSHLNRLPRRVVHGTGPDVMFHVYGQTTADFVKAVSSENFRILRDRLFNGKEEVLHKRLGEERVRLGKTMAQVVLGTPVPNLVDVRRQRDRYPPDVFAIGGGGGFNDVTLKALQMLGVRVVAGVPGTDDGGSTGKLQRMLADTYGYLFGVGDAAAILERQVDGEAKRPILSFRPSGATDSLTDVLIRQIKQEVAYPTIVAHNLKDSPDYLSFVCEQLNFARVIDAHFGGSNGVPGFSIKGASIRNLNILAAFHRCDALDREAGRKQPDRATQAEEAERAWFLLEEALGLDPRAGHSIPAFPVSYERATLWATYRKPIPASEIQRLSIPEEALSDDGSTVYGQQYIDQILPEGEVVDFGLAHPSKTPEAARPSPNAAYLDALNAAQLFIMGAGSLFGSQLAQLAVPGVVDALIQRKDIRKVLVVNHVCMNETMGYSLTDHIKAIERLANKVVHEPIKEAMGRAIRIGDIFTDIVVPRTVAREIDAVLQKAQNPDKTPSAPNVEAIKQGHRGESVFVNPDGSLASREQGILFNRYVKYVLNHQPFRAKHQITDWELRVLGFLDQPPSMYRSRSEAGRYRGAVYALEEDIQYLIEQGIPRRHIYEVESIAMNTKILKAEGKPQLEIYPGLIPESLVGIFKILLVKGAHPPT